MAEPIRVLCVFSRLDRGGAETMCMNLYRHMDRSKVQFDFVKHTPDKGLFEDEIVCLGGRVFEAPRFVGKNYFSYEKWWNNHFASHPEHRIVHGHFFTISPIYFRFAKRNGCTTIAHSHCTKDIKTSIKAYAKKLILKRIEKHSDYCLSCSKLAGEWLFRKKPFSVLKNAIDTEKFSFSEEERERQRKKLGISGETLLCGTVGRFDYQKNPFGLIDIYKKVKESIPNSQLLWIGDGSLRPQIERKIAEAGLSESVILTGVRNDVNHLMQAMDVFLLPSFFEGLPVVAIEAQAAGLPSLLSDTISEEVAITDLCKLLPLDRLDLWLEAICSIHSDNGKIWRRVLLNPDTISGLQQSSWKSFM